MNKLYKGFRKKPFFCDVKLVNKRESHLKSQVVISQLFSKGKVITTPPFRLVYLSRKDLKTNGSQILISVPKKRFKLAVSRNAIKRKISEAFRLYSSDLKAFLNKTNTHLAIGFIYIGSRELRSEEAPKKMQEALEKLLKKLKENEIE